jgi:predicted RNA binding protein YcfA (HicA-like mRNA interferase family)
VIREQIRNGYGSRPVGYREAPNYLDKVSFRQGVSSLLAQVFNPALPSAPQILPPGIGVQRSELTNHFLQNFTIVVEARDSSLRDFPMSLTVPDRDLKRLLKAEGFYPTDFGNGSHEVWKRAGSPMITIPNRKDQAGLKFLKSAAESLGFRNIRELQEAARHS